MPRFSSSFQANGSPEDPSAYTLLGIYILIAFSCATAWLGLQTEIFSFFGKSSYRQECDDQKICSLRSWRWHGRMSRKATIDGGTRKSKLTRYWPAHLRLQKQSGQIYVDSLLVLSPDAMNSARKAGITTITVCIILADSPTQLAW